jgi:hypothetical protein
MESKMTRKTIAYLLLITGILLLEIHTTFPVLWRIFGLPGSYPLIRPGFLAFAQGVTPMLGALSLLIASMIYGKKENNR